MKVRLGAVLALALGAPAVAASTPTAPQPPSPFRWDDDPAVFAQASPDDLYARLKYIPLAPQSYLSLGADLRERVEASDVALLGFRDRETNGYDLHRLLVFADARLGSGVRAFVQLGEAEEAGRQPAPLPTDVDRLDLAQAFVDLSTTLAGGRARLRLGRAEMSYDDGAIIGLRDGPNVRQVWDGARLSYDFGRWRWDAFAVKPVSVKPGVFDDGPLPREALEGVHATLALSRNLAADGFYYHNTNPTVRLYGATGPERTDTAGLRLRASWRAVDGSLGAIGQTGRADGRDVRAFALHGDIGAAEPALPWRPHLTLRVDVLSGGDPSARRISTFNALYPNVAYSTEATIEAPANLIQPGVVATISPTPAVSAQYTLEALWRYSARDAFYAAPLLPLVRPDASHDTYSGTEQQIEASWRINRFVSLKAALVRFSAGAFVRNGGGRDEDFGMTSVSLRL